MKIVCNILLGVIHKIMVQKREYHAQMDNSEIIVMALTQMLTFMKLFIANYDRKKAFKKCSKMLKNKQYSFTSFFLTNNYLYGNNNKLEFTPDDLRQSYNQHMSLGPKISDLDMTIDDAKGSHEHENDIDSRVIYKGLTKLSTVLELTKFTARKK